MSGCGEVRARFTEYLDGRLNGKQMQFMAAHLDDCGTCAREWTSLRQAQASLADSRRGEPGEGAQAAQPV